MESGIPCIIDRDVHLGTDVKVWHYAHVSEGARIGARTTLGHAVFVGRNVVIGEDCKIANHVSVFTGVKLGNGVFVGPAATFTNDRFPRADSAAGEWECVPTIVEDGASIGANATIRCGVTLGERCMVGAGAVVTRDVPPGAVVVGNPARYLRPTAAP